MILAQFHASSINFRTGDPQNLSSLDDPGSRYIKLKDDNINDT